MTDTKKIIKKVKIKKPNPAPAPAVKEQSPLISIEQELADIDVNIPAPKNDREEEDEFEALLNQFIETELKEKPIPGEPKPTSEDIKKEAKTVISKIKEQNELQLGKPEQALYDAYTSFLESVNNLAEENKLKPINQSVEVFELKPNYKPSIGKRIASDTVNGWDIILKVRGPELASLNLTSSDEELLDFAEACEDNELTLIIISYVETMIEIEGNEIIYLQKSEKIRRKRIERLILEEHQARLERNRRFIKQIEDKKFPINAERLINNYFKTSQKDPDGAYKVLTTNPAMFAPIEVDKIQPRFFGLIKPGPKEGIRINQRLAEFLKKLKA